MADSGRGRSAHRGYTVAVFIVLASLDNVAIGLTPPLASPIGQSLGVSDGAVRWAVSASYLITALAAVGWAYLGDRTDRKRLLMTGTLLWSAGTACVAVSQSYPAFLAALALASLGLGAVASVGFSVVTDLITPRRRGLVMSLWGLSQGVGTLAGTFLGGVLGRGDWRFPFLVLTVVGLAATVAYLFTYDIRRGQSEPALAAVFAAGEEYEYRIRRGDLPGILHRRTNVWLIAQGLTAQLALGSFVWLPNLIQARAEHQGYSQDTAIVIGSVFAVLFQLGGALSIVGGLIGDRLQRRTPRGRALVAAVGVLASVPFFLTLFFVPLRVSVDDGASTPTIVGTVLASVFTEPAVTATFLAALIAAALMSANSPNWYALIVDVNPPEHRGTVYSMGNLVNGVGRATGTGLVGVAFRALQGALPPPMNYATGLALFQVFFVPTGLMYYQASRTSPADIETVAELLRSRAAEPALARREVRNAP